MRHIRDPRQSRLFDSFDVVFSDMARRRIAASWPGVFRALVLQELPVAEIARHFSPEFGCPTKELYSMAGLIFLSDFFDWSAEDAADAYMLRTDVQFALNIEPRAECCSRTVERFICGRRVPFDLRQTAFQRDGHQSRAAESRHMTIDMRAVEPLF